MPRCISHQMPTYLPGLIQLVSLSLHGSFRLRIRYDVIKLARDCRRFESFARATDAGRGPHLDAVGPGHQVGLELGVAVARERHAGEIDERRLVDAEAEAVRRFERRRRVGFFQLR